MLRGINTCILSLQSMGNSHSQLADLFLHYENSSLSTQTVLFPFAKIGPRPPVECSYWATDKHSRSPSIDLLFY